MGPNTSEIDTPNPFSDYRLELVFTHTDTGKTHKIPGYYAADGDAANTSADSGNIWRAHFAPDKVGEWSYLVSFRAGNDVAIDDSPTAGSSAGHFDGDHGVFTVSPTDKTGRDLRGKGHLNYVDMHHLRFAETGEYFLKAGVDSPENFLAYEDFDATPNDSDHRPDLRKSWSPHAIDYDAAEASSFTWQSGKGTEILGAINYLASKGLNSFSFLTFNIDGDDDNVFPHRIMGTVEDYEAIDDGDRWSDDAVYHDRFDVSKMAQWENIFAYGTQKGMYLHFKTQETENDQKMDGGNLGPERKLYYRELIARFGHHPALNWNLGEESTNTDSQRKEFAQWFYDNDPYQHHVVVHTYSGQQNQVYTPMLGDSSQLTGPSLQTNSATFTNVFPDTKEWVERSADAGKPWVVACDEPGDARDSLRPFDDQGDSWVDARKNALWGNVMAGGAGVEFYFGYDYAHSDLTCQDYRSRDGFWDYCRFMLEFFEQNDVPFQEMSNENSLSSNSSSWCLRKTGEEYIVFLKDGGETTLDLSGTSGSFDVRWYDPRSGGGLQLGSVPTVEGGSPSPLGDAPSESTSDWVVLVRAASSSSPSPWTYSDIGSVGVAGNSNLVGNTFTISASGSDIGGTTDEFGYLYQTAEGDGEILAQIGSLTETDAQAKAGVMIRSTTAEDSNHVSIVVTPGEGISLIHRQNNGETSIETGLSGIAPPQWLKLVRRGHMFTAYYGTDGINWTKLEDSVRAPISRSALVGVAVSSADNSSLTSAQVSGPSFVPDTFPRLLFIRGGDGTGDTDEDLADIGDFSRITGNHGWGEFADVLINAGYSLDAQLEGPVSNNSPVDLTAINLFDYAAVVFASNNADYTMAQIDALEHYVRHGGGAVFISDAHFGLNWADAPNSDQLFLDRFGLVINQDFGTYPIRRSDGDFTIPGHPIFTDVDTFDGEGVSPFVLNALPIPQGATITKLANAKNDTRNNDADPGKGSTRPVNSSDASLVTVEVDYGRVVGHFDRNTFFNERGKGTEIHHFDNMRLAINLMNWVTGELAPITPYQGWAQSHFSNLPTGRDSPMALPGEDPDGDGLYNIVEFALGTNPNAIDDDHALVTAAEMEDENVSVTIQFLRRNDEPDLGIEPEISYNLESWQPGTDHLEAISSQDLGNGYDMIRMKILPPPETVDADSVFVRVRVTPSE